SDERLDRVLGAVRRAMNSDQREGFREALGRAIGAALALHRHFKNPLPTRTAMQRHMIELVSQAMELRGALDSLCREEVAIIEGISVGVGRTARRADVLGTVSMLQTLADAARTVDLDTYALARTGRRRDHATHEAVRRLAPIFRKYIDEPRRRTN